MLARLVRWSLGPGKRAVAQSIADDLAPQIVAQPGCQGVTVFGDDSDGEGGLFALWETQAYADAASAIMSPQLNQHLTGHLQRPLEVRVYDVLSK